MERLYCLMILCVLATYVSSCCTGPRLEVLKQEFASDSEWYFAGRELEKMGRIHECPANLQIRYYFWRCGTFRGKQFLTNLSMYESRMASLGEEAQKFLVNKFYASDPRERLHAIFMCSDCFPNKEVRESLLRVLARESEHEIRFAVVIGLQTIGHKDDLDLIAQSCFAGEMVGKGIVPYFSKFYHKETFIYILAIAEIYEDLLTTKEIEYPYLKRLVLPLVNSWKALTGEEHYSLEFDALIAIREFRRWYQENFAYIRFDKEKRLFYVDSQARERHQPIDIDGKPVDADYIAKVRERERSVRNSLQASAEKFPELFR